MGILEERSKDLLCTMETSANPSSHLPMNSLRGNRMKPTARDLNKSQCT